LPRTRRLPLFPLPVVLFPGAPLPLHIFEARYRRMVADCLEGDRHFGLIHHDCDERGPFLSEEGRVGCLAEIVKQQPLPDGRSMILARGVKRFRLVDEVESDAPYYEALVADFSDTTRPHPEAIRAVRARTLELFHAVLETMSSPPDEVPVFDLNRELAFQLAPTIQIDCQWQQSLLELRDEVYRLERLDAVFQAAVDRYTLGEEGVA
jgi:ATP-dependent Lon protease